jgi:hypothetical protein
VPVYADEGLVDVWEFERDVAPGLATRCALGRVEPPDMKVLVTSSTGDTITVHVQQGALIDPTSLLYVERRGLFEIVRVERQKYLLLRATLAR